VNEKKAEKSKMTKKKARRKACTRRMRVFQGLARRTLGRSKKKTGQEVLVHVAKNFPKKPIGKQRKNEAR